MSHFHCAEGLDVYYKIEGLNQNVGIREVQKCSDIYISHSFLGGEYFASENKILNFLSLEISEFFFRMFICGDIVNKIVLKAPVTH